MSPPRRIPALLAFAVALLAGCTPAAPAAPVSEPSPAAAPVTPSAPGPHPTRELKFPLSPETRGLEVEELHSGAAARADIHSLGSPRLGFRVVVDPDGIRVSRDYDPPR